MIRAMCILCVPNKPLDDFDEKYGIFTWPSSDYDFGNIDEADIPIPDSPTTPLPETTEEGV